MFLVDVEWITAISQRAEYLTPPPPPATPLFPAEGHVHPSGRTAIILCILQAALPSIRLRPCRL